MRLRSPGAQRPHSLFYLIPKYDGCGNPSLHLLITTEPENPLDPSHRRSPPSWRLSSSPARRVKLERSSLSHNGYLPWFPAFAVQRRSTTAAHACRQPSLPSPSIRCLRSTMYVNTLLPSLSPC
ncbi:hypothetical protein PIB30_045583 [Stylosanthes scabra]|uniref:Uncharacterized protein n=1 Tax=Stylosanthes scabra TaxID=79078 RepID=A0ABU6ZEZ9_9FABA|nr:hypothetical protein [Stylosanthes scabra]